MGADAGEPGAVDVPEPVRRRATFVPRTGDHGDAPDEGQVDASDLHDDDELAGALENEVSLLTASLPIIRPESLFLPVQPQQPPYEPRTDAEREIAAQAESGDTLAAIERLEALLSGRAAPLPAEAPPPREEPPPDEPPVRDAGLDADVGDDADDVPADVHGLAPIATPRVRTNEGVLSAGRPEPMPVFAIERSGTEPTPRQYRVGQASRLFWLWFPVSASVLVVGLGALLVSAGLNLIQVGAAALLGIALSFIPLGLSSLTGAWSGQPTVIVSRATFGVVGNTIPAALILVVRMFWGAALLWLLSVTIADSAVRAGWTTDHDLVLWSSFAVAAAVSIAVALVGYALVAAVQAIATIATALLALAIVVGAWPRSGWDGIGRAPFGEWIFVVEGAVLVFSLLGLAWASAGGDLARYQRVRSGGTASALWAGLGASVPLMILVVFGGVVALAEPTAGGGFTADPVRMLVAATPHWFAVPVIASIAVGLVSALVVSIYSGGFAVQAVGIHLPRWASVLALGVIAAALGAGLVVAVPDVRTLVLAYPTTLAVPVAAWTGIFTGDFLLRNRRLATDSLLNRGRVYPDWRWANVVGLVVISAIGLGFMRADTPWLRWEGYLYRLMGVAPHGPLASADLGVLLALALGLALGVVAGRRAVPAQESASR
ncbi:hypothetical protein GCM10028798_10320 [Humibacter antri]